MRAWEFFVDEAKDYENEDLYYEEDNEENYKDKDEESYLMSEVIDIVDEVVGALEWRDSLPTQITKSQSTVVACANTYDHGDDIKTSTFPT